MISRLKLKRFFHKPFQSFQRFFHDRSQFPVIDKDAQLLPGIPAKMKVEPPLDGQAVGIEDGRNCMPPLNCLPPVRSQFNFTPLESAASILIAI
jgi:hypothetical protein